MTRDPITDPDVLDGLDDAECVEGYLDGFRGEPMPGPNRSYAYWHCWHAGASDGGHIEMPAWIREVARRQVERSAQRASNAASQSREETAQ